MSRKLIPPGLKDEAGAYIKEPAKPPKSIDGLLAEALMNIERIMDTISMKAAARATEREDVQSLKDLVSLLQDMKEKERELLDSLTDEELEAKANGV